MCWEKMFCLHFVGEFYAAGDGAVGSLSDLRSENRELMLTGKRLGSQTNHIHICISSRAEPCAFT